MKTVKKPTKKRKRKIIKCKCGDVAAKAHICPYAEDINGDSETLCNCCDTCVDYCIDDI